MCVCLRVYTHMCMCIRTGLCVCLCVKYPVSKDLKSKKFFNPYHDATNEKFHDLY